jgi:DNA-nicking Smr family endonuclease
VTRAPDGRRDDGATPGGADDVEAFEREMAEVRRIEPDPRGRVRTAPRIAPPSRDSHSEEPPAEVDREFVAAGVDRRELRKLKRGDYAVADRRDLHGTTADAACESVARFLENSRQQRHRCVCIVHGRGLHSDRETSVLKTRVRACLRANRSVLAYADAPPSDGGAGAVYVLLRK